MKKNHRAHKDIDGGGVTYKVKDEAEDEVNSTPGLPSPDRLHFASDVLY